MMMLHGKCIDDQCFDLFRGPQESLHEVSWHFTQNNKCRSAGGARRKVSRSHQPTQ